MSEGEKEIEKGDIREVEGAHRSHIYSPTKEMGAHPSHTHAHAHPSHMRSSHIHIHHTHTQLSHMHVQHTSTSITLCGAKLFRTSKSEGFFFLISNKRVSAGAP